MKAWLKPKSPCLLIAHNCKCFDAKHLMKAFESTGLYKEFSAIVPGFSDTLTAFRELLSARKSHSQENLVQDLLLCSYEAHNAIADAQSLFKLVSKFLNSKLLAKHSFSVAWVKEHNIHLAKRSLLQQTLQAISTGMATKIADSGLGMQHLQLAFQRGGADGLELILKEKFDGKARVTGEAAWPSGRCVGLAIRRSRVRVLLWPLAGFVLSRPEFKFSATLVNSQLVAFCQLGFLILLCCI